MRVISLLMLFVYCLAFGAHAQEPSAKTLFALDRPFTFAYVNWEKRVRIDNGRIALRGEG